MNQEIEDLFYGLTIWGVSVLVPLFLLFFYFALRREQGTRQKNRLVLKLAAFLLVLVWLAVVYGSFIESKIIIVNRQTIDLPRIEKQFKLALVADLHYGPFKNQKFAAKTVEKIISLNPQIVVIAGDIIFDKKTNLTDLEPWSRLSGRIPTFAVLGNHEFNAHKKNWPTPDLELAQRTREALESYGVVLLENQAERLNLADQSVYLIGLGELWVGQANWEKVLDGLEENITKIAFAHNPDAILEIQKSGQLPDLFLAGHTHGGQIRLPIFGPLGIIPTKLGQKFDKGLFNLNGLKMFITSGLGETNARARLFNPPEIVLLEIN